MEIEKTNLAYLERECLMHFFYFEIIQAVVAEIVVLRNDFSNERHGIFTEHEYRLSREIIQCIVRMRENYKSVKVHSYNGKS